MKTAFIIFVLICLGLVFYPEYEDYMDQRHIAQIQWDITVGGDGVYTSKDGKYELTVVHPYPATIGHKGDETGFLIFSYMGGYNYISHPNPVLMQTFKKR
jgi:hypothetical protein